MGIVLRQSAKNIVTTYLGFLIGAINILFLYTSFLSEQQYGLVSYLLSVSNILTPFLTFGVHNTFIKYYFSYTQNQQRNRFVTLMFVLPLCMIAVGAMLTYVGYNSIYHIITKRNAIDQHHLWTIFLFSALMAYFEVFYAWAKVQLRTVEGNWLKEVFPRVVVFLLLWVLHWGYIGFEQFIILLLIGYFVRTFLMFVISFRIHKPLWDISLPKDYSKILVYCLYLVASGSIATLLIDIDKFMLNFYLPIEYIAFYSVAVFVATVIVVPYRSIYQLINPMISKLLHRNQRTELIDMYHQATNNLYWVGAIIFLLIVLNAHDLYSFIPSQQYQKGLPVLWFLAFVKLYDTLTGVSNAVIFNSAYYKVALYLGIFLVVAMVGLNSICIPRWGIVGASVATFLAFLCYNTLKIGFVYRYDRLHPFSKEVGRISLFILMMLIVFLLVEFPFSAWVNIVLRSSIVLIVSLLSGLYFDFSKQYTQLVLMLLQKKAHTNWVCYRMMLWVQKIIRKR